MKVAMIGSKHYQNSRKIKETLTALRSKFLDDLLVISGGGRHGADAMIKKYAIEFGIDYKEYNPAHTPHNLYSGMSEGYYGRKYHVSQFHHRNGLIDKSCDVMIVFQSENDSDRGCLSAIKAAKKKNISVVMIN